MRNIDNLIQKANRIGAFFEAMPDHTEAIEGIVNHIQKFWEPRMRIALLNFLTQHPSGQSDRLQLSSIVLQAITLHRNRLTPLVSP